ncbi:hypothetical protein BJ981_000984 [Sphaerisporangium krabiense]|uniref:Uncharacterized protein n=1 Tax=Sphaerisporangium krabiense TaxID=763782 RepID=A0A7W9DPF4_9ACTN|nr:hypothetical protein [Sphaerisporangium krabiense]
MLQWSLISADRPVRREPCLVKRPRVLPALARRGRET